MPKKTKKETEKTINIILNAAQEQLIYLGYDNMSYTTLSQQTGISRTGISHHFPKKTDFIVRLEKQLIEIFFEQLDFTNKQDDFIKSWLDGLNKNEQFIAILKLFFLQASHPENTTHFTHNICQQLHQICCQNYGTQFEKKLEWLIGKSLFFVIQL